MTSQVQVKEKGAKQPIHWSKIVFGIGLMIIALGATRVDLLNNYHFGLQTNEELAHVMALAAIGVTALPAAAALSRWDWVLRLGTLACILLTVWAAVSAYGDKQGKEILIRQAANDRYEAAQRDAELARKSIKKIKAEIEGMRERGTVKELLDLAQFHREKARIEKEERGGCGSNCREHETHEAAARGRLPAARAREVAMQRLAAEQLQLKTAQSAAKDGGPAEASMVASWIARKAGGNARDIARTIALTTTTLAIAVTLLLALLAHQAVSLIMQGVGSRDHAKEARSSPRLVETAKKRVRKAPTVEERIDSYIQSHVEQKPEDQVLVSRLYDNFQTWWVCHAPQTPIPSKAELRRVMTKHGMNSLKKGGTMRYPDIALVPFTS